MSVTIEEGLVAHLLGLAGVTAVVGAQNDARLYPAGGVPDEVKTPYITYAKASAPRDSTHGGDSALAHSRLQLSFWSEDYLAAKRLARVVIDALNGYRGRLGGVERAAVDVDNEIDLPFVPEERFFQVAVDLLMWNSEN